tara:strand:+ start:84 stop:302 length:219 start_codon:yes stop_codon:yes gene_type:complete
MTNEFSKFDVYPQAEEEYSYDDLTAEEREELHDWLESSNYWDDDDDESYDPDAHRFDFYESEAAEYEYDDIF